MNFKEYLSESFSDTDIPFTKEEMTLLKKTATKIKGKLGKDKEGDTIITKTYYSEREEQNITFTYEFGKQDSNILLRKKTGGPVKKGMKRWVMNLIIVGEDGEEYDEMEYMNEVSSEENIKVMEKIAKRVSTDWGVSKNNWTGEKEPNIVINRVR